MFAGCSRERSATLTGNITLEDRNNHEGIELYIPGTQFRAMTDEDGDFAIEGLQQGEWTLVAQQQGYETTRQNFEILHFQEKTLESVILNRIETLAGSITGFVKLDGASTHEGVAIMLVGTLHSTTTNTTGHFLLENIPPGDYTLLAVKEGWTPASREGVHVQDDEETELEEIVLHSATTQEEVAAQEPIILGDRVIRGVALLEGMDDHEYIKVSLQSEPNKATVTNTTGYFELTDLGDELYDIEFSFEGYTTETWFDVPVQSATGTGLAGIITLRRDTSGNGHGLIQGTVTLEGVTNHANTLVRLLGISQSVITDESGRYMFIGIPAGNYALIAEHQGYETERVPNISVNAEQVTVVDDIVLSATTATQSQGNGQIIGLAILDGEMEHGGITVAIPGTTLTTVTGGSGEYRLDAVPAGFYTLIFSKGGFKTYYLEGMRVIQGETTQLEPVVLVKDIETPYVLETFPTNNARRVPVFRFVDVFVRFSERMNGMAVKQAVMINPPVSYDAYFDNESEFSQFDVLHLRLYQNGPIPMQFNSRYNFTITPTAMTPKGISMLEPFHFSFTTDGPLIVTTLPEQNASGFTPSIQTPIMFETNAPVNPATVESSLHIRPRPDAMPIFQFMPTEFGTRILIETTLRSNTRYTFQLDNKLRTVKGERFSNTPFSLRLRTANMGGNGRAPLPGSRR